MKTLVLALFVCVSLSAQVSQEWIQNYNGNANGNDQAISVVVDNSGNLYLTGVSAGSGTAADIVTIKYNPVNGDTVWVNRYTGLSADQVYAMTCDNNSVYITGWTINPGRDIITIKYDASTGDRLWVKTYNGTNNGGDYGFAIAVDLSGNVYVTGRSDAGVGQKFTTLKYDSFGNMPPGWPNVYTGGISTTFDESHAIKVDASGNVYVTGISGTSGTGDYLTLKINSNGTVVWAKKYNGDLNSEDNPVALVLDNASNNVYVGGYSGRTGRLYDYCVIKYAASNGDSVAAGLYNGPANFYDWLRAMTIDQSDNIYVTGSSHGYDYDYTTVKFDNNLIQQWVSKYSGPGNAPDYPNSISVDGLGNVYVSGYSMGVSSNNDFATVMYNSIGTEKWVQRYNGPASGFDAANTVAVDVSGNVYVAGWSTGIVTGAFDFTAIKYSQLPVAPSNLIASADSSRNIQLTWSDNSNYESGYKLERSTNGGNNWSIITALAPDISSYLDTGLTSNSVYYYRVFCFNAFGNSLYSNIAFDTAMSFGSAIDNVDLLISMIIALKNDGTLSNLNAALILANLRSARKDILHNQIFLAKIRIYSFILYIRLLSNIHVLSMQQGQQLINIANNIISQLHESNSPLVFNRSETPKEFALNNNYPNPFNPVTTIKFAIAKPTSTKIVIYDILGKEVEVLLNTRLEPGIYETSFDGTNFGSGIYFYRIETEFYTNTKKMIMIK